jgi:hypothetical protein
MEPAVLQSLLAGLGPDWPAVVATDRADADTWLIALDDAQVVIVEWVAERDRILLTTPLGTPSAERRIEVYETLLGFNSLRRKNAGMHMAVQSAKGSVLACADLDPDCLTAGSLQEGLQQFIAAAREWSSYVTAPADTPEYRRPPPSLGGTFA